MTLKAGAAEIVITPPVGVELAGYGFGPSVGMLDDLKAQALVLRDGAEAAAIVTVDLLLVSAGFVARVRERVEAATGVPGAHVIVAASHSHSAPTAQSLRQWGPVDPIYVRTLEDHLVGLVALAAGRCEPARLSWGKGEVRTISENRRQSPDGVDWAVPVVRVDTAAGVPLAVLANFSCHPVTLHSYRNLLSPDYPGTMRRVVRGVLAQTGGTPVVMFTLGAAGDVNPAGYVAGGTTPARSWQVGAILGCEVAKAALEANAAATDPVLAVATDVVELPVVPLPSEAALREVRDASVAEAARLAAEGRPWADVSVPEIMRDWAIDALAARVSGDVRTSVPCEVTALRIGPVAVAALPLEVFTATGLATKAASPAALTMVVTNANGGVGYLPTEDAYTQGDYTNPEGLAPKIYGIYALAPEAEPLVRARAAAVIQTLYEG